MTLDPGLVARLTAEMAAEFARTGPPPGFPAFPRIPAGRYTSQPFFDLEREHLWRRTWVCAGHRSQIPTPNGYRTFDELGVPLVLTRDADGVVRCFANTCEHRGAPVARDRSGTARYLRCNYHGWTYASDTGALVAVPDERDFVNFDRCRFGLAPVRCEQWGGFVFVTLDPDAISLSEYLAGIDLELGEFPLDDMRVVHVDERTMSCNWKIAVEAFQEVYHFRFIHDRDGTVFLDSRGATMGLLAHGHSRMVTPFSAPAVAAAGMADWSDYRAAEHRSGLAALPGVHPIFHSTSYAFSVFPNLVMPIAAVGFPFQLFWPIDQDTTLIQTMHLAPDWGDGEPPEAWSARIESFARVIDEDVQNLAPMYRSLRSPLARGVTIGYQERRIWHFNEEVDRRIGTHRVPADLRVAPLLSSYVEQASGASNATEGRS